MKDDKKRIPNLYLPPFLLQEIDKQREIYDKLSREDIVENVLRLYFCCGEETVTPPVWASPSKKELDKLNKKL